VTEPIHIAVSPQREAGYKAAAQALADHAVTVKDPRLHYPVPREPAVITAAAPKPYSVEAYIRDDDISLYRSDRLGFMAEWVQVDYPVSSTHPQFATRLAEVLVPVAETLLAKALEHSVSERATLPPGAPAEATKTHRDAAHRERASKLLPRDIGAGENEAEADSVPGGAQPPADTAPGTNGGHIEGDLNATHDGSSAVPAEQETPPRQDTTAEWHIDGDIFVAELNTAQAEMAAKFDALQADLAATFDAAKTDLTAKWDALTERRNTTTAELHRFSAVLGDRAPTEQPQAKETQ
jgi:hypothetical protein